MRDLGRAVTLAAEDFVSGLETPVPILACHQHFLADVGEDLLNAHHQTLRNLFRRFRLRPKLRSLVRALGRRPGRELPSARDDAAAWIRSRPEAALPAGRAGLLAVRSLAQWALDYAHDGDDLGFPFDRPYLEFYRRVRTLRRAIDGFLRQGAADAGVRRALRKLARILEPVVAEVRRPPRRAPAPRSGSATQGPSAGNSARSAAACESGAWSGAAAPMNARPSTSSPKTSSGMAPRSGGMSCDFPEERVEASGSSRARTVSWRLSSTSSNTASDVAAGVRPLRTTSEHLPPEAALAHDLTRPDYVELVCGSLGKLPELFADLDMRALERRLCDQEPEEPKQTQPHAGSLSPEDRAIVRAEALRERIEAAARSRRHRSTTTG